MFNKHCKDEHQIRYLKSLYLQAVGSSVQETFYEHPSLNRAFEERAATGNFKPRKRQILRRGDTPANPFLFLYVIYMFYPLTSPVILGWEKFGVGLVCISITHQVFGDIKMFYLWMLEQLEMQQESANEMANS
jgi:hypothetical protein